MKIFASTLLWSCSLLGLFAEESENASVRLNELERKVELLTQELERERMGDVFVPVGESQFGLGPAASKIYSKEQGISIGGYGEGVYRNYEGEQDAVSDLYRAILYVGHKFDDHWVLNTEFEFEHGTTDAEGSVSAEMVTLDYLHSDALNFRTGLMLIPMGFVNEMHEPTTFPGVLRPDVESTIIPSTWRENGIGLFGERGQFSYKAYLVNGLKGSGFTPGGLRGGRQDGSKAVSEDLAGVIRVDLQATPELSIGGSLYQGKSGQELAEGVDTQLAELHAEWKWRGLGLRVLGARATLSDVARLNRTLFGHSDTGAVADAEIDSIGETMEGGYVELSYNVFTETTLNSSLTPFIRIEQYNTQAKIPDGFKSDGKYDVELITTGLAFQPIEHIVFKAEIKFYDNASNSGIDQFNLGFGYIF